MKLAHDPRAQELLVERALRPLDDNEHWELRQLDAEDDDSFDLAAAGLAVAMTPIEPMPAELAAKVWASSPGFEAMKTIAGGSLTDMKPPGGLLPGAIRTLPGVVAELPRATTPPPVAQTPPQPQQAIPQPMPRPAPISDLERARERKRSRFATIVPWLAAAACLALAIGTFLWARDQKAGSEIAATPPLAVARDQLLANAPDVTKSDWTATTDPAAKGASGDVVWSQREQRGYMRFVGLEVNDAKQFQYQLWIFDKNRDDKYPIDGGVFDVTAAGEVIVPITAKISVDEAVLFAVTVERPGGVVVSKRERIVVTAARKT